MFRQPISSMICCTGLILLTSQAIAGPPIPPQAIAPLTPVMTVEERRLTEALEQTASCRFEGIPLQEAFRQISSAHALNILVMRKTLIDAGYQLDAPVHLELTGVKLRTVLESLLTPLALSYVVKSEVVIITTDAEERRTYHNRVYPVGDLVSSAEELDVLVKAVKTVTIQGKWDDEEGGAVTAVPSRMALVVRQTRRQHDQILGLLKNLRDVDQALLGAR